MTFKSTPDVFKTLFATPRRVESHGDPWGLVTILALESTNPPRQPNCGPRRLQWCWSRSPISLNSVRKVSLYLFRTIRRSPSCRISASCLFSLCGSQQVLEIHCHFGSRRFSSGESSVCLPLFRCRPTVHVLRLGLRVRWCCRRRRFCSFRRTGSPRERTRSRIEKSRTWSWPALGCGKPRLPL